MKVLHIIKSLGRGGAETLLPETLKLHNKQQFEFHYLYFLPWKNQMVAAIQQAGGIVNCFPSNNNISLMLKYRSVIRYVREHEIDVIHCHLPWAGFLGRLIHWMTRMPVIYTEHNKQERYHWITRLLNRLTFNWQTAAVAVSVDVNESIQRSINVRIPVIEVLNGVNTQIFTRDAKTGVELRAQLGIPQQGTVVGTVAVFRFQKRLKEWLDVFAAAAKTDADLYGIMVGDGQLREELISYRKHLGLEQRVFMPGLQQEVRPWLSAIDIYLMTSVYEGLPVALLEAMSMECAVVTTDAGGIKEVVRPGVDGLLESVDQWRQLSGHLTQLHADLTYRRLLSTAARQRVMQSFDLIRMVHNLEDLYFSTLARKG